MFLIKVFFSYADFETQLLQFGYYGVLLALIVLPVLVAENGEHCQ